MAEENMSRVKEMIPDESCCSVSLPPPAGSVNLRRYSTGALDKRGGKAQTQTRYRGNQASSTHDLCKHGKRREDELVIKPWKLVKIKNVEGGGGLVKGGVTLTLVRKSLHVAKRDATAADASEVVKSCDALRSKRSVTRSSNITPRDSAAGVRTVKKTNVDVKKVSKSAREDVLKNLKSKEKKTKIDEHVRRDDVSEKKVSRISENRDLLKSLKSKEKTLIDKPVRCDDVVEKTLYVVESSIEEKKVKKKSIYQSREKKILRSDPPRPIRQMTSRSKNGLSEKKESGSSIPVANTKTESKVRPKRIGLKATPPPPGPPSRPVSFKKGKILEPKAEDPTVTSIKFKKRVVQEPKLRSDMNKKNKNLKDKGEGVRNMSYDSGEGKREKVVLRHRKVEEKKKVQALFNNVIEETVNKLGEERNSSRVKALVGAFETVISLQDNDKTSLLRKKKKIQNKSTSSQVVEA